MLLKSWFKLPVLTAFASFCLVPNLLGATCAIALPKQTDLFCYHQRPDGQIVDLRGMCKQNPNLQKAAKTASPGEKAKSASKTVNIASNASRVLEFIEYNYDGSILVGIVRNKTDKEISDVRISYVVYTKEADGTPRPIKSGSVEVDNQVIEKGDKSSFTIEPRKEGDSITITKVETR